MANKYDPLPADAPRGNYRWKPDAGNAWNPLKGFPRNNGCFCGSGLKAKHCCLPKVQEYCGARTAAELRAVWSDILNGTHLVQLTNGEKSTDDGKKQGGTSGQKKRSKK